jgi:ribosomal protein L11 methyltransferase
VTSNGNLWRLAVTVASPAVAAVEAVLDDRAAAVSTFEIEDGARWRVEALVHSPPRRTDLESALARVAATHGIAIPGVEIEPVAEADWVRLSETQQPPVRVGRYFIHGSHIVTPPPMGALALRVDAGLAFGTGLHESTRGCLLALDRLARARRFRHPLDLGCGTGILAMAMALIWRVPITAADIDPVAVAVARNNARDNGLARWVRVLLSDGFADRGLGTHGPYDLITANILARPLVKLAPATAAQLTTDGVVVLSGLLGRQEAQVTAAYRAQGLPLKWRVRLGEWSTLVMGRG